MRVLASRLVEGSLMHSSKCTKRTHPFKTGHKVIFIAGRWVLLVKRLKDCRCKQIYSQTLTCGLLEKDLSIFCYHSTSCWMEIED